MKNSRAMYAFTAFVVLMVLVCMTRKAREMYSSGYNYKQIKKRRCREKPILRNDDNTSYIHKVNNISACKTKCDKHDECKGFNSWRYGTRCVFQGKDCTIKDSDTWGTFYEKDVETTPPPAATQEDFGEYKFPGYPDDCRVKLYSGDDYKGYKGMVLPGETKEIKSGPWISTMKVDNCGDRKITVYDGITDNSKSMVLGEEDYPDYKTNWVNKIRKVNVPKQENLEHEISGNCYDGIITAYYSGKEKSFNATLCDDGTFRTTNDGEDILIKSYNDVQHNKKIKFSFQLDPGDTTKLDHLDVYPSWIKKGFVKQPLKLSGGWSRSPSYKVTWERT